MNPLTLTRKITQLNQREAQLNVSATSSWHNQYKDSAWIFIGGLPFDLSEGDVICVFSQFGEPVQINLVRDKKTGKSRGFCFLCYEDQRSTVLAVDNLNGAKVLGRTLRVDHVAAYKAPKEDASQDELVKLLAERGCGPDNADALLKANEAVKRHDTRTERDWREGRESRRDEESGSSRRLHSHRDRDERAPYSRSDRERITSRSGQR